MGHTSDKPLDLLSVYRMHFRSWVSKNPVVPLLLFGSTFGVAGYRYYNFTTSLDTIISDSKLRM